MYMFIQILVHAMKTLLDWQMALTNKREEWKFVSMGYGGQYVTTTGSPQMDIYCASKWDFRIHVWLLFTFRVRRIMNLIGFILV